MIIAVTECIAKNQVDVNVAEYQIEGYDLFVNEVPKRGIAMYVHSSINAATLNDFNEITFEESIWVTFDSHDGKKILIGCVYRSPNSSDENTNKLSTLLVNENFNKFDDICIVGDFNFPKINWEGTWSGERDNDFVECVRDAYLFQMVKKPTRRRTGQQPSILDLVLVNNECLISDIQHLCPLGKSDHEVLCFSLYIDVNKNKQKYGYKFNFKKGAYELMRQDFQKICWDRLESMDVEECWQYIKTNILNSMEKHIPKIKNNLNKRIKPSWLDKKALRSIKKKHKLYKHFLKTKSGLDYLKYIKIRNECNGTIRRAKREYEKLIAKRSKSDPKMFWKYVNEKLKSNVGISSLKKENGVTANSDEEKANTLNTFFASVFTIENKNDLPKANPCSKSNGVTLTDIIITAEAVKNKLKKLNPNKAQGPDGIPAKVLSELHIELALPLSILFNKTIEKATVPIDWKEASVTALFKKGTRSDPGNYRPVSLTSITCKIIEAIIRDAIVDHMTMGGLYTECQHGFRKHRSCVTQLLEVLEDFTLKLDNKETIDVVYLDFKKAFDSVPHERLLIKLEMYGITGNVLLWIRSFLEERVQRVRVGREMSEQTAVLSGIPQGSILGPVLFTIFINDLPDLTKSTCKIFADDTKLYDSVSNSDIIQEDLNRLQGWCDTWNLYFNSAKCKVMHIGGKNPRKEYKMKVGADTAGIQTCNEEKDLGVIFDGTLKFDLHIQSAISKANRMIGILRRTFTYLDKDIFLQLYKALIRPHVEYGNAVWYPHLKRQSAAIERVQRRATKIVGELKDLSYRERLQALKLMSLKTRRVRGDLIHAYKILYNIDDIHASKFFIFSETTHTRNSVSKLFISHSRTNIRKFTFSNRVPPIWNGLPVSVKTAPNISAFKNAIDKSELLVQNFYDYDE